jgi:hypothetical protein
MRFIFIGLLLACCLTTFAQNDTSDEGSLGTGEKHLERLRHKHASWLKGFVINLNGDTIRGKIKPKEDYSNEVWGIDINNPIHLALAGETDTIFYATAIAELYVADNPVGFQKYISLFDDGMFLGHEVKNLFRVIADGKCKLVYNKKEQMGTPTSHMGTPTSHIVECYYVYYKAVLTNMDLPPKKFRAKCKELFSECPDVTKNIEGTNFESRYLESMVNKFNECLASAH